MCLVGLTLSPGRYWAYVKEWQKCDRSVKMLLASVKSLIIKTLNNLSINILLEFFFNFLVLKQNWYLKVYISIVTEIEYCAEKTASVNVVKREQMSCFLCKFFYIFIIFSLISRFLLICDYCQFKICHRITLKHQVEKLTPEFAMLQS